MRYRMICIDLDGTLLRSDGSVSPENAAAIGRARGAGVHVVLCTGRGLVESRHIIAALDHHQLAVLVSGAQISDPSTGRTLHRFEIPAELAHDVAMHLDTGRDAVLALVDPERADHDYVVMGADRLETNTRWWFEHLKARLKCVKAPVVEDFAHTLRLGIVGPGRDMPGVLRRLKQRYGEALEAHHFHAVGGVERDIHVLEVFRGGVHKWTGIQWLAEHVGVGLNQIAAIGDNINDLTMIQSAGLGIAMRNAVESILAIAHQHTHDNDNHGVAHAIEQILEGRW